MKYIALITFSFCAVFILNVTAQAQQADPDSLFLAAEKYSSERNYTQARIYYNKAKEIFLQRGDSLQWFEVSLEQGESLIVSGDVKEALAIFQELDSLFVENVRVALKAKLKNDLGLAHKKLENLPVAIDYYLEALEIANQINDSLQIGRVNSNISYAYRILGDYETAIAHQQKAQEIFEELGDSYRLSNVLNARFLTLMGLEMYSKAEPYIRKSLELREELGKPRLLDIAYHNLAWSFETQGKRDSAIIYYRKSLELSRQLGNPYDMTVTLNNIGNLYLASGDYENALAYYNEALEANYQTDRPISIAHNLRRLGWVATQNNDYDNAAAFYEEAEQWLSKTTAPRDLAVLYGDIADNKILKGNTSEAEYYLNETERLHREYDLKGITDRLLERRGRLYAKQSKLYESLNEYRKAYRLAEDETLAGKINPTMNLAKAYHRVKSDSAFILADEAFSLMDSLRTNVAGLAFRSGLFRKHAGFYNEVASWYITHKNQPEKAFNLIEGAKARVLMDELAEAQEKVYENLDEAVLIRKQQLTKQIDRLYRNIESANSEEERSSLRDNLKDLEFKYQSYLNEIHESNPVLRNFDYPKPVGMEEVQEILEPNAAVLEYAFAENNLIRILITQDEIKAVVIDSLQTETAKEYLTEQVKTFRQDITGKNEVDKIKNLGSVLYQELIPDLQKEKISNLLIVSDGALTFLPFEAMTHNGRYLIQDVNIKYLPSVSIYPFINAPHRAGNSALLAVAGSGFEGTEDVAGSTRSQASFSSLPSTLLEVDSIAINFPEAKILKNEEVSEATLKAHDLGDFRFLHFATHAFVNETTPSQSGLLLSKNSEEESLFGEDGHLNSREISGLNLNADLVTLSACNTGMGKVVTGEGLLGLQRSFLSAGASSVIVSLWSIYDRSTSEFMAVFYKQLLFYQEEDFGLWNQTLDWFGMYEHPLFDYKTKALQDTKLAMIDHPYYNHPVYWAPFIIIGK